MLCNQRFNKRKKLRARQQPHVAEHQGRTDRPKRSKPHSLHTQGTLHCRLQPLYLIYTEKYKVSCSGFIHIKNKPHATVMRPLLRPLVQCVLQQHVHIHAAITCHYNAICIHMLQNTKRGPITPETSRNDPNRNHRTQKVPFIAACSDFTRKSMRFRAPALIPPKHKSHATFMYTDSTMSFAAPCTHSCSHYNAIRIPALQNTKGEPMTR